MPGALDQLLTTLRGTREGVFPSIQAFPVLDVDQVASDMQIVERGLEAGRRNQPEAAADFDDATEIAIQDEVCRRAAKSGEDYRSQLALYDGRIQRSLIATDQRALVEAAGESALADFGVQAKDDLDHLFLSRKEVEARARELRGFQARHGLTREPHLLPRRQETFRWLIVGILILLESILNGLFFAEGSDTGLVGGVTQALVLSFLNVGSASLFALYLLPLLRHARRSLLCVGLIGLVVYLCWLLGLNLSIAHFRDLFIEGGGAVSMASMLSELLGSPLNLKDAQSWLLFSLGVAFSIIAVIDVAGIKDPYLGYGAYGRRREDAVREYNDFKSRCMVGLTDTRDDALAKMASVITEMKSAEYDLRLAVGGRTRLIQDFKAFLDHLDDAYRRLIQTYREANRRARSDAGPTRFNLRSQRPPCLSTPPTPELPDLAGDARKHVVERMEHFIRELNGRFEEVVARYHSLDAMTAEKACARVDA